jgi:TolA-binding protein
MNWAEAIVLIVIASGLAKVVSAAIQSGKQRNHTVTFEPDHQINADLRAAMSQNQTLRREVEDLRERVRVLERIATADRNSRDLSDEIDRLR